MNIERMCQHDGCEGCKYMHYGSDDYPCNECKMNYGDMYEAEEPKTETRIEVIRCKDCRYWEEDESPVDGYGYCKMNEFDWDQHGFCNYARRKYK